MTEWRKRIREGLRGSVAAAGTVSVDVELYYAAIVACLPSSSKPAVVVTATMLQAEALAADLMAICDVVGETRQVFQLPEVEMDRRHMVLEHESERSRVLHFALGGMGVFVGSVMAMIAPATDPQTFRDGELILKSGMTDWPPERLAEHLVSLDYDNEVEVHVPGEFSWRGGILDFFSPIHEYPVRADYFGDEIESLQYFDPGTQRSLELVASVRIIPRGEATFDVESDTCFLDYFDDCRLLICDDTEIGQHLEEFGDCRDLNAWKQQRIRRQDVLQLRDRGVDGASGDCPFFALSPQFRGALPDADNLFDNLFRQFLGRELTRWAADGYVIAVCCDSEGKLERFKELTAADEALRHLDIGYQAVDLSCGIIIPAAKVVMLSGAELFREAKRKLRGRRQHHFHTDQMIRGEGDLHEGDFAVHALHGICRYLGLRKQKFHNQVEEVLVLEFRDELKLYVPLDQAYLVGRYIGGGQKKLPTLSRVRGTQWQKARAAAEEAVTDLAAELIRLQAVRETIPGFPHGGEEAEYEAFADAFGYEETADQITAIRDVEADMSQPKPMDRLLCGDVGYGKTEVAMRGAFQAVQSGKQVAVLVPTTILVQQHYLTFHDRFSEFPITIESISRFRTTKEQHQILKHVEQGGVDIIIGTHRLLGRDVKFKDLGLLVVDEEQRFGVTHKERLKQMRADVDVLTMTATPIPRTLYLAMAGLRDMSTIMTAPLERRPVKTVVAEYDDNQVQEAILREIQRGGQVYYLHNRVKSIEKVCDRLMDLVPEASFDIGHGQMDEGLLEATMLRFFKGETDVLVCTTIIESGLDVPNANTIIIDDAQRFGLADLYQLRGRVGRYHRQAYAYLMLPKRAVLQQAARERLTAIRKYTQLGVGFKLAMRDLEIRGAGNLLGAEQSGHIVAIGFDLYCQLMKEAVGRLRDQEVFHRREVSLNLDFLVFGFEDIEGVIAAAIPPDYVSEEDLRIELYRRLSGFRQQAEIDDFADELRDRFGPVPEIVTHMLEVARLKLLALSAGIHGIAVRDRKVLLETETGLLKMPNGKLPRLREENAEQFLEELVGIVTYHAEKPKTPVPRR